MALALLMIAAAMRSEGALAALLISALLLFPAAQILLRDTRLALYGACIVPAAVVLHDVSAWLDARPLIESLDAANAIGPPPVFTLFCLPLVAGGFAVIAVAAHAERLSRLYVVGMMLALLIALAAVNYHFSMS